jgi:HEAT repeat protein
MGGLGPEMLPDLIAALDHEHSRVVMGACVALHEVGPQAKVAVSRLIRLLEKDDPATRTGAIYAFMGIGPEARAAVPALIKTLTHENFHMQYWACRALARIGPGAKAAVPVLLRQLREGLPSVRRHAALALGGIGPDIGQQGLEALVRAIKDPLHPVREDAARALGQLGPFAKSAAPALQEASASESLGIRVEAATALWLVTGKPEAAVAVLIEKLEDLTVGCKAAEALVEIGPPAAEAAVPAITKLLESEDAVSRLCAAEALGRIGPAAKSAVPALTGRLEDADEDVRGAAAQALKQIERQPAAPESPRSGAAGE